MSADLKYVDEPRPSKGDPSPNRSESSSVYHTAPFIQSSLRHLDIGAKTREGVVTLNAVRLNQDNNNNIQEETEHEVEHENQPVVQLNEDPDLSETTPLLFKDPPTLHECSDGVTANDIIVERELPLGGVRLLQATDELNDLLTNSGALLSGGITSPSTLTWLLKFFVDLYNKYPSFAHLIIFLGAVCLAVYLYLSLQAEAILTQASYIDIEQIAIVGVSDVGVDVHVAVSVRFEYAAVVGWTNRLLGLMAGIILGKVTIHPLLPVDLFVEVENVQDMHRLVRVIPPVMTLDLSDGGITTLEFDSTVSVISTSAVLLLNSLLDLHLAGEDFVNLTVSGSFHFDVASNLKNYKGVTYDIDELVSIDLLHQMPTDLIDSFDIHLQSDPDLMSGNIEITTKTLLLPVDLQFGKLHWDIMLPLCRKDRLKMFGSVVTSHIVIEPYSKINLKLDFEIPQLPKQIVHSCPGRRLSPLNHFLVHYLSNDLSRSIYITASSSGDYSLPLWLQFILERINIPVSLGIDQITRGSRVAWQDYLVGYNVSDLKVSLQDQDKSIRVSSSIRLVLAASDLVKEYLDFKITQFQSSISLLVNNTVMCKFSLDTQWQPININYTDDTIVIDINIQDVSIDIVDPGKTSWLVDSILSGNETTVDLTSINAVDVDSSIFSSPLYELPVSLENFSVPVLPQDMGFLLSDLNTTIQNVIVVESDSSSVTLLVDLEILNPFPVDVDLDDMPVSVFFGADSEFQLGEVASSQTPTIPSNACFNTSLLLYINPEKFNSDRPEKSITILERLLSCYLSGNDTQISVFGHEKSLPSFPELSKVIDGLSAELVLPKMSYDDREGFIVSSTMHIMTSEIEFTVYNPLTNREVIIEIIKLQASYEGTMLGHLERQEILIVPPGLYTTPRLPIAFSTGIGGNILRKALNGDLKVHGDAIFRFSIGEFVLDLVYSGNGLTANVRL